MGGGTALRWLETFVPRAEAYLGLLLHRLSLVSFQTMLAVHALLIMSACWLAFARNRWSAAAAGLAVIGFSLTWFGVNHRWEGRVLLVFSPGHGLTEADLLVPVAIALALVIRGLRFVGRSVARRRRERRAAGVPTVLRTMWPKD
jgi:hypothetical protein